MKKIILVDDDAAICDVFTIALDQEKYNILAYTKSEPILVNQVEIPDLFVLDKNIAGTNGLDVCRFIKSSRLYNQVPVVIISATPNIGAIARQAGADDVIIKPFTLKTLRTMIEKYTDGQGI